MKKFQVSAANQVLLREGFSRDKGEEGPGSRRTSLRRKRHTCDVGRGLLGNVRPTNKGHFEGRQKKDWYREETCLLLLTWYTREGSDQLFLPRFSVFMCLVPEWTKVMKINPSNFFSITSEFLFYIFIKIIIIICLSKFPWQYWNASFPSFRKLLLCRHHSLILWIDSFCPVRCSSGVELKLYTLHSTLISVLLTL